jgi:NADH-quinone oxidoreductase subunit J
MTLELMIFVIVAAVAIFSAAFMLISRNAVHSALFLVTNFLCVAFFYVMLNAPFLGMIQITVYAGAIMVLFVFVIMLLGAERLSDEEPRYPWLVPAAAGLTTIFLVVAFVSIVQGNVGLLQPVPHAPQVRFVHASAGVPAVDVYLNNDRVAHDVTYRQATDFAEAKAGQYNLQVFPACTESDPLKCADPIQSGTVPLQTLPASLDSDTTTTFVMAGAPGQLQLLAVPTDLSALDDESTLRLTAVNALPGSGLASLVKLDPAAPTDSKKAQVLAPDVKYGAASQALILPQGDYSLAWLSNNSELAVLPPDLALKNKTHELLILAPEIPASQAEARPTVIRIDPAVRTREAFGSPQDIGLTLFSSYLLPFELLSLLLLAAMVGAIILTREEVIRRVRQRLVVSPAIRRLNHAMTATADQAEAPTSNPKAESPVNR